MASDALKSYSSRSAAIGSARTARRAHICCGWGFDTGQPAVGLRQQIVRQRANQCTDEFPDEAAGFQLPVSFLDFTHLRASQRGTRKVGRSEQPGPQPIVDIVAEVGDVVGQRGDLRLQPRPA